MSSPDDAELEQLRINAQAQYRELRSRKSSLDKDSIDLILKGARSHYAWKDKPVSNEILKELYELTAAGATSMNCCPARFVFVSSSESKEKLAKSLKPANVAKVMSAPVTAIIAYDLDFWEKLPFLFPHDDRRGFFKGKTEYIESTAFRNSTLQGGYFMIAARALGLDIGAISGFSNDVVDQEFFANTNVHSNFLCNLGYADETALFQKLPRFAFDEVCTFL